MRSRPLSTRLLAAAMVLVVSVAVVATAPEVGLVLGPALLLFLILAVGVFPGEDALARARSRRLPRPRARVARSSAPPVLPDVLRPVGVALAFALAMRPPPDAVTGTP